MEFLADFNLFLTYIFSSMTQLWVWFNGTTIGLVINFILIITIFLGIIKMIISLKGE